MILFTVGNLAGILFRFDYSTSSKRVCIVLSPKCIPSLLNKLWMTLVDITEDRYFCLSFKRFMNVAVVYYFVFSVRVLFRLLPFVRVIDGVRKYTRPI